MRSCRSPQQGHRPYFILQSALQDFVSLFCDTVKTPDARLSNGAPCMCFVRLICCGTLLTCIYLPIKILICKYSSSSTLPGSTWTDLRNKKWDETRENQFPHTTSWLLIGSRGCGWNERLFIKVLTCSSSSCWNALPLTPIRFLQIIIP